MLKKILIIQTASIGDVILSTALAETLHQELPHAEISCLVRVTIRYFTDTRLYTRCWFGIRKERNTSTC